MHCVNRVTQPIDLRELVSISGEEQGWAADLHEVLGAHLLRTARRVEWIAEAEEGGEPMTRCGKTRHATSVGVAAHHDPGAFARRVQEVLHRRLRAADGQSDRAGFESARAQTLDVRSDALDSA